MALMVLAGSKRTHANQIALQFVTKQFPPYAFVGPAGQATGPMVDVLFAACAKANVQCSVRVVPWRRALRLVETNEVDGIFPIVDSSRRRADFELSPEVVHGRYVLLGLSCRDDCVNPRQLATRTVAVHGPSEASRILQDLLKAIPGAQAQIEPDHEVVMRKLLAGRYGENGLALVNDAVARRQMTSANPPLVHTVSVVRNVYYAYAFARQPSKDDAKFRVFKAIDDLCRSGETARIFKPYDLLAAHCRLKTTPKPGSRLRQRKELP